MSDFLAVAYAFVATLIVLHFRQQKMGEGQRRYVWGNLAFMGIEIAAAMYIAYLIDQGTVKRWPKPVGAVALVGMFFLIVHGAMRFQRVRNAVHENDYETGDEKLAWIILGSVFGILIIYAIATSTVGSAIRR